ncbi:FKBP-type peptidyl-prolyl cis-trans isomerase [Fulvivirga lutimaris]|uniref:FKBP-type peptidyl-prolyl cis-trans isomerase n=1 Tax=Fulvivirga lutimaris TaxID=1819566 RepID=UPI0012BC97A5|nr:FKBP-type peptidyl-prolyl cis-trans isomerase [Fulvivirga lutimaris]MTI38504.1 hypothetical protein [Fulvivirga lutimaris]
MRSFKLSSLVVLLGAMFVLNGCLNSEEAPTDPTFDQFNKDLEEIDAYLASNGIEAEIDDYTAIRYVVNNQGTGLKPYPTVADSLILSYEGSILKSGVVFDEATSEKFRTLSLLAGIIHSASFIQEGGSVTAYAPSYYGFGDVSTDVVPANSILKFDVALDKVLDRQLITEIAAIDAALEEANEIVSTDPSGIRFTLEQGGGNTPNRSSVVTVSYEGRLFSTGEVFDSNPSATFSLENVISGWQIMVPKMQEGGRMRMILPSPFAYGTGGSGDAIPPNAILEFDVELISIN